MMKKSLSLIVGLLMIACFAASPAEAADDDDFKVTMAGAYLEVNIINASWDIGTVQMSTSYWTNETSETQEADVTNCTQGTYIDFEMVVDTEPAVWISVWATNYTTGADSYKLNASNDSWSTQAALENVTYHDVAYNHNPVADIAFDLRFDSPTSTTSGIAQTVTLNGKVTVH